MKTPFLILSAASLLAFAHPVEARESAFDDYLASVAAAAQARLQAAGVETAQPLTLTLGVGGDGRVSGARVVEGSDSLETDAKVRQALRHARLAPPPSALAGRSVRVTVGGPRPLAQAKLP